MGPHAQAEIAERLISRDNTLQLVAVPFSTSFVAPSAQDAVVWLQDRVKELADPPPGLEILWTGDAVIGRDYMRERPDVARPRGDGDGRSCLLCRLVDGLPVAAGWRSMPLATIGVCAR